MSTTLSTTSRQFEPSMRTESQDQLLHSSENAPSMRGMVTAEGGGAPCGSFQTNSCLFCSTVVHARVLARGGTRCAYGTWVHRPSPPQRQSWKGQATASPLTVPM